MKTIKNTENITIKVSKDEIINEKWLAFQILSKKLADIEKERSTEYKYLRSKMYNSQSCSKYNTGIVAGINCIDITNPMKQPIASLVLTFEVV